MDLNKAEKIESGIGANDTEYVTEVLVELDNITSTSEEMSSGNVKASVDAVTSIAYTRTTLEGANITSSEVKVT